LNHESTKTRKHESCPSAHRELPFQSQFSFEITFEKVIVGQGRIDLIVAKEIVGLLFNFNAPTLTIKRLVLD
jgi:hypothetical protein